VAQVLAPADGREQAVDVRLVGGAALALALLGSAVDLGVLCPLRRLTDLPCPLCGLTTGCWAIARGDLAGGVQAHPLAPAAVAFLALAWTPWGPSAVRTVGRHPVPLAMLLVLAWTARLAGIVGS
jgi:hypothetical protein